MELVGREQVQRAAGVVARTDDQHPAEGGRRSRNGRGAGWRAGQGIGTGFARALGARGQAERKSRRDESQGKRGDGGGACDWPLETAKRYLHLALSSGPRLTGRNRGRAR